MSGKTRTGILLLCLGVLALTVLAGCNTMKGVGEDVGAAGDAIERGSGR